MKLFNITENIFGIHADIKTDDLFEGIWPVPLGVTLNSYLIKDKFTCLIDLFRPWSNSTAIYTDSLNELGVQFANLDYVILNHLEPDHSSFLSELLRINKKVKIVSTQKGIALVKNFLHLNGNFMEVKNGDTLNLGTHTLTFYETPNVHWPETMMTYDSISQTLFSCDAFGSYGALGERMFDDEFTQDEHIVFEKESLRYYANIVASFSAFVKKAIEKLSTVSVKTIAPSHGIIWRQNPNTIIKRYLEYADYTMSPKNEVCIVWGSMYGFTKQAVDAVVKGLEQSGTKYTIHRVPNEDISYILPDALRAKYLVLAMPTYEYKMFPPMASFIDMCSRKHIIGKTVLRLGSWGWVGGAQKEYEAMTATLNWKQKPSIEWQGIPTEQILETIKDAAVQLNQE